MSHRYPPFDGTQLCAQTDPEAFILSARGMTDENQQARKLCGDCHWQDPCLDFALHHHVADIWGGTTERQRTRIRSQRGIVAKHLAAVTDTELRHERIRNLLASGFSHQEVADQVGMSRSGVEAVKYQRHSTEGAA